MSKTKSWEITDDFWSRVEPLISVRERPGDQSYSRAAGGGRKPKDGVDPFSRTPYRSKTRSLRCPIPKRHIQRNFASR
jgi:putative transposase